MQKPSSCPRPSGAPRWVAMVRGAARDAWVPAAESPYRAPVLYAVGEMTRTVRARGGEPTVALWGPGGGGRRLYDAPAGKAAAAHQAVTG